MRGRIRDLGLVLALGCAPAGALLPEAPPDGLRLELTLECDFTEHFWNAVIFYDRLYPVDLRFRLPARVFERTRAIARDVSFEDRLILYRAVRDFVGRYRLGAGVRTRPDPPPGAPGVDVRPRSGAPEGAEAVPAYVAERTLTISMLTVREGLGRVDELVLALDLTDARAVPAGLPELAAALTAIDRRLGMDLGCAPD